MNHAIPVNRTLLVFGIKSGIGEGLVPQLSFFGREVRRIDSQILNVDSAEISLSSCSMFLKFM